MSGDKDFAHGAFRSWDRVGRAAERFARKVADEAGRFAERVEEHVSELANGVRESWREERCQPHGERSHAESSGKEGGPAEEVQRAFREVRVVLRSLIDGVDDVIGELFGEREQEPWTRVIANHAATCEACGGAIAAGAETWARRGRRGPEFRCLACAERGAREA